ncbi:hypothetical protein [Duncaniella freteri]|uniref:hypothetical protein n=1 Tax=Duncaniella freteri TaxID=2530391 RepID=UPI002572A812|nr:hypothetical protein [Duncaniella freteri]
MSESFRIILAAELWLLHRVERQSQCQAFRGRHVIDPDRKVVGVGRYKEIDPLARDHGLARLARVVTVGCPQPEVLRAVGRAYCVGYDLRGVKAQRMPDLAAEG